MIGNWSTVNIVAWIFEERVFCAVDGEEGWLWEGHPHQDEVIEKIQDTINTQERCTVHAHLQSAKRITKLYCFQSIETVVSEELWHFRGHTLSSLTK